MLRALLQYLLPLFLPLLAYTAYVLLAQGRLPDWLGLNDRQWLALGGAGIALMMISMVAWSALSGSPPGEIYMPPRVEDGQIVPATTVAE
jgi:hypothetical protein